MGRARGCAGRGGAAQRARRGGAERPRGSGGGGGWGMLRAAKNQPQAFDCFACPYLFMVLRGGASPGDRAAAAVVGELSGTRSGVWVGVASGGVGEFTCAVDRAARCRTASSSAVADGARIACRQGEGEGVNVCVCVCVCE